YRRPFEPSAVSVGVTSDTVIADLVEVHGDNADRILRRYGLYCCGCTHAPHDTIAQAARCHGITSQKATRVLQELNRTIPQRRVLRSESQVVGSVRGEGGD